MAEVVATRSLVGESIACMEVKGKGTVSPRLCTILPVWSRLGPLAKLIAARTLRAPPCLKASSAAWRSLSVTTTSPTIFLNASLTSPTCSGCKGHTRKVRLAVTVWLLVWGSRSALMYLWVCHWSLISVLDVLCSRISFRGCPNCSVAYICILCICIKTCLIVFKFCVSIMA